MNFEYAIFKTRWGYCGILASERGIRRFGLPVAGKDAAGRLIVEGIYQTVRRNPLLLKELQDMVCGYFAGKVTDFSDVVVDLEWAGEFERKVLSCCRKIGYGRTSSYGQIAERIGRPGAGRAVGNCMAKNPIPLIIPCHRILCKDGKLGGYSGIGGIRMKERMIRLEGAAKG